jgi:hypothetical protein
MYTHPPSSIRRYTYTNKTRDTPLVLVYTCIHVQIQDKHTNIETCTHMTYMYIHMTYMYIHIVVATRRQDSMSPARENAVLSKCCN